MRIVASLAWPGPLRDAGAQPVTGEGPIWMEGAGGVYDPGTSPATPPPSDHEHWSAQYVSSNGASASVWTESARRLVVLGYITAITLPLIGLIVGIVVVMRSTKPIVKHGVWIIIVSVIATIAWILVFTSGALTTTNNELS